MQPQVDGSCALHASHGPLKVPGIAAAIRVTARWLAPWCFGACWHESELWRRNRAEVPQERTPHRMQPQVDGSCALDASHRPLNVIGTTVTCQLTALCPASVHLQALLDAVECRRPNRGKLPQERTPRRMQPQVDGSCALDASHGPLKVPGIAAAIGVTARWPAEWCFGACSDESEQWRRNRAEAPQEHTPHRMQPQVDGSCAPATPFRSLKVPGTAVPICLTALWPAKWRCGAVLDAMESRRLKRGKLPQERTLRRVQPQVDGCCALTTPCGSVNAPGIAVAIRLRALWPAQCRCGGAFSRPRPCGGAGGPAPSRGSARQAAAWRDGAGRVRLAAVASRSSGDGVARAERLCAAAGAAQGASSYGLLLPRSAHPK
jgi:hypothetical protein